MIDVLHIPPTAVHQLLSIGLDILLKASVLILVAIGLNTTLFAPRRVLVRSAIWNALLVGLLILPVAALSFPRLRIQCLSPLPRTQALANRSGSGSGETTGNNHDSVIASENELGASAGDPHSAEAVPGSRMVSNPGEPAPIIRGGSSYSPPPSVSLGVLPGEPSRAWLLSLTLIAGIYAGGVVLLLLRLTSSLLAVRRLRQSSTPLTIREWATSLEKWRQRLEIKEDVLLATSTHVNVPLAFGWLRPVVLVPASLVAELDEKHRDAVLVHELAHIRRGDYGWQILLRLAQAVYWIHPLVWSVGRFIGAIREQACDDLCTYHAATPQDYRATLVQVAATLVRRPAISLGIAMARSTQVEHRLERIDRGHCADRCLVGYPARLCVAVIAVVIVVTVGPIQLARRTASAATVVRDSPLPGRALADTGAPLGEGVGERIDQLTLASPLTSSRSIPAWELFRLTDVGEMLSPLVVQMAKAVQPEARSTAVWKGEPQGTTIDLDLRAEQFEGQEIVIAFFADPLFKTAPLHVRSFLAPGRYTLTDIPPREYYIGAVMGMSKTPLPEAGHYHGDDSGMITMLEEAPKYAGLGIHESWPKPLTVNANAPAAVAVLVSPATKRQGVSSVWDSTLLAWIGRWKTMEPSKLVTVKTVDQQNRPVPYCIITFAEQDPGKDRARRWLLSGTDANGVAYCDALGGAFYVTAMREGFDPQTMADTSEYRRIAEVHYAEERPIITIRWDSEPTGGGHVSGRVHDQHGEPIKEYYLRLSRQKGERLGSGDYDEWSYHMPVRNPEGNYKITHLAFGKYGIGARALDFPAYTELWPQLGMSDSGPQFTLSAAEKRAGKVDVELEAKELLYGRALYADGTPVSPGLWTAWFAPPNQRRDGPSLDYRSGRTEPDGSFRVSLSTKERHDLIANAGGKIQISALSGNLGHGLGEVGIDRLSKDKNSPAPLSFGKPAASQPAAEKGQPASRLSNATPPAATLPAMSPMPRTSLDSAHIERVPLPPSMHGQQVFSFTFRLTPGRPVALVDGSYTVDESFPAVVGGGALMVMTSEHNAVFPPALDKDKSLVLSGTATFSGKRVNLNYRWTSPSAPDHTLLSRQEDLAAVDGEVRVTCNQDLKELTSAYAPLWKAEIFREGKHVGTFVHAIKTAAYDDGRAWDETPAQIGVWPITPGNPTRGSAKKLQNAPATTKPAAAAPSLDFLVVHRDTGQFMANVELRIRISNDERTARSHAEGHSRIELPLQQPDRVMIQVNQKGFVPVKVTWDKSEVPAGVPRAYTLKLQPGTAIGGIIKDEAGDPIAGATAYLLIPGQPRVERADIRDYAVKSGADGRWRCDVMPANLSEIWVRFEHPDYANDLTYIETLGDAIDRLRKLDYPTVLKKGLTLAGRVLDEQGRPVVHATVGRGWTRGGGDYPIVETDGEGRFKFVKVKPDDATHQVVLTAFAADRAPDQKVLTAKHLAEPIEFRLNAGRTIRGRVVDLAGKPVAGARVSVHQWREHNTLNWNIQTDADGRITWNHAPVEKVTLVARKQGFMETIATFQPDAKDEQNLRMPSQLRIRGHIIDADSGESIPRFTVVPGIVFGDWRPVYWERAEKKIFANGSYNFPFDQQFAGWHLRVEADGYETAVSRKFMPDEGAQVLDFKLKKASGPSGVVRFPDGKPVVGAEVALATTSRSLYLQNGRITRRENAIVVSTDEKGRFSFLPQIEDYAVAIVHERGYAELTGVKLKAAPEIMLQPWARVEGTLRTAGKPLAHETVAIQNWVRREAYEDSDTKRPAIFFGYDVETDDQGAFRFERMPTGEARITHRLKGPGPGDSRDSVVVKITPGETIRTNVDG